MIDPLINQRTRIPTSKSDSATQISQISHEALKVSFSILSILQSEQKNTCEIKNFKESARSHEDEFNREYAQFPKMMKKLKAIESASIIQKKALQETKYLSSRYLSEYFDPTEIYTPVNKSKKSNPKADSSQKSDTRKDSTKINKSKTNCQSKQKSIKIIKKADLGKIAFSAFGFENRHQLIPRNCRQDVAKGPYSPRTAHNVSKNKTIKVRTKPYNQIVVICHEQNHQKPKNKKQAKNQKATNKENISPMDNYHRGKDDSSRMKLKFCQGMHKKDSISQRQVQNDYWNSKVNISSKTRRKQQIKSRKVNSSKPHKKLF